MSLKDKAFEAHKFLGERCNDTQYSKERICDCDKVVKLSDAEEEINHIEDVWVAVNNGKTLIIKEQGEGIQTLESKLEQAESKRAAWEETAKLFEDELVRTEKEKRELGIEVSQLRIKLLEMEKGINKALDSESSEEMYRILGKL